MDGLCAWRRERKILLGRVHEKRLVEVVREACNVHGKGEKLACCVDGPRYELLLGRGMKLPLGLQPGRPLWTAWASFWVCKNENGPNLGPKLGLGLRPN